MINRLKNNMTLYPKKVKYRKWQKGRHRKQGIATRGTYLAFGAYGLQAQELKWLKAEQIEAARKAIMHFIQRGGKVWIRVFPDKPITRRPPEVTMGGGKGDPVGYVVPLKPGRIIFEMDGVPRETAISALKRAAAKLPLKTKIIFR